MAVFVIAPLVITEQADVDRGKQREHQRLDYSDEQLHKIEHEYETGAMEQIFSAEDVAEKSHRKGERPDGDGEDLNQANGEKDQRKHRI